jgi:hypothetical protein
MAKKPLARRPRATKPRNAAMPRTLLRRVSRRRNAAPRTPSNAFNEQVLPLALGSAITAGIGVYGAHREWPAENVAGLLTAGGAVLAWKGEGEAVKNVGTAIASSGAAQLGIALVEKKRKAPPTVVAQATAVPKRPANAGELPPEALREALERWRLQMALEREMEDEAAD